MISQKHIKTYFGRSEFFEFHFTNPYDEDTTFEISKISNRNLRIICDIEEWKYLRSLYKIEKGPPLEKEIFSYQLDGTIRVFLRKNELIAIPFIFQSFEEIDKTIDLLLSISNLTSRDDVAFLNISINYISTGPVGKIIRFWGAEEETIREKINMDSTTKFIRSTSKKAFFTYQTIDGQKLLDFKYHCSSFSSIPENFRLLFYDDQYMNVLSECWLFFVHSYHKINIHVPLYGNTSNFLVIKGELDSRIHRVTCTSNCKNLEFLNNSENLEIVSGALTKIKFIVNSSQAENNHYLINIIGTGLSNK
jgi:hypothetical protein